MYVLKQLELRDKSGYKHVYLRYRCNARLNDNKYKVPGTDKERVRSLSSAERFNYHRRENEDEWPWDIRIFPTRRI